MRSLIAYNNAKTGKFNVSEGNHNSWPKWFAFNKRGYQKRNDSHLESDTTSTKRCWKIAEGYRRALCYCTKFWCRYCTSWWRKDNCNTYKCENLEARLRSKIIWSLLAPVDNELLLCTSFGLMPRGFLTCVFRHDLLEPFVILVSIYGRTTLVGYSHYDR